jgi:hypothetical protein
MLWEINLAIRGYHNRLERQREIAAQQAMWTARCTWSKRPVSFNDLLGRAPEVEPMGESLTTKKQIVENYKARKRLKEFEAWKKSEAGKAALTNLEDGERDAS